MTEPIVTPEIEALLAEFTRSGVRELHVRGHALEIYLSSDPTFHRGIVPILQKAVATTASTTVATPSVLNTVKSATELPPGAVIVRASNLGTFYGAPKPGAPPYVTVGSSVKAGSELCLIEVMKLFTAVRAATTGRVHAILASDGEMVEAGQPLFAIVED